MAISFAHKWGQVIGNLVQASVRGLLQEVADQHCLYLDYQRARAARSGKKVAWQDRQGNIHDLDYVLERGGTEDTRGLPVAFIETAWRRYTKHSRNKAQEIQGAILALAETYSHLRPFLGVVVAGVFTKGSLDQLRSCGFVVAYFPYETLVQSFALAGIDASFDESTKESEFRRKIRLFDALSTKQVERIQESFLRSPTREDDSAVGEPPMERFIAALKTALSRGIQGITIIVLHGVSKDLRSATEAIVYIQKYSERAASTAPATKYEVRVRYNNGDVIEASFQDKADAIQFLRDYE